VGRGPKTPLRRRQLSVGGLTNGCRLTGRVGWPFRPGRGRMAKVGRGGPALFTWPAAEPRSLGLQAAYATLLTRQLS
jgi:hypothetical protein